jgi:hypothetical protein
MLDDLLCEAIHDPAKPLAKPENQGRNAGMSVVGEIGFDALNEGNAGGQEKETENKGRQSI